MTIMISSNCGASISWSTIKLEVGEIKSRMSLFQVGDLRAGTLHTLEHTRNSTPETAKPPHSLGWCVGLRGDAVHPRSGDTLVSIKHQHESAIVHLLVDHVQFALIPGPNIPGFYATLLQHRTNFTTRHIHN